MHNFLWASQKNYHPSTNAEDFQILMHGPLEEDVNFFSQGPVPDHIRTTGGFQQDLFKSFSQRPVQNQAKASDSISLGSAQGVRTRNCKNLEKDLHARTQIFSQQGSTSLGSQQDLLKRTCTRSCKDLFCRWFQQDVHKIFSEGPVQERISPGSLQDHRIRSCARSCRDLSERSPAGSPQGLLTRAFTRSRKNLLERTTSGSPQELLRRTTVLCEPAQSKCTWTCHKSHFMREFTGKMPQTRR